MMPCPGYPSFEEFEKRFRSQIDQPCTADRNGNSDCRAFRGEGQTTYLREASAAYDVRIFDDYDVGVPQYDRRKSSCEERALWDDGQLLQHAEATVKVSRNLWFHTGDFGIGMGMAFSTCGSEEGLR